MAKAKAKPEVEAKINDDGFVVGQPLTEAEHLLYIAKQRQKKQAKAKK